MYFLNSLVSILKKFKKTSNSLTEKPNNINSKLEVLTQNSFLKTTTQKTISAKFLSIISLTPIDINISNLKLALYISEKILYTSPKDFMIIINNVLVTKIVSAVVLTKYNNHIIELTCNIPSIYNSSNIYIVLGTINTNLNTTGNNSSKLRAIFPYILCENIKISSFTWFQYSTSIQKAPTESFFNILQYKFPKPLNRHLFEENFGLLTNNSSTIFGEFILDSISILSSLRIHLYRISSSISIVNLGDIHIKFKLNTTNYSFLDNILDVDIKLDNSNSLVTFSFLLPKELYDIYDISYIPTEYLYMTEDKTRFFNTSYIMHCVKPHIIKKTLE